MAEEASYGDSRPLQSFKPKKLPQFLATLAVDLGAFALGNVIGWAATSLPNIYKDGDLNGLKDQSSDGSWISSLCTLGSLFAGVFGGKLIELMGRRPYMLAMCPPFVAGWVVLALAGSPAVAMVGRFVTGFCGGAFTLVGPVYVSEVVQNELRGLLGSTLTLFIVAGILFMNVIGALLPWRTVTWICLAFPILQAVMMFFMPESPRYLLSKGKRAEALKALKYLRGAPDEESVLPELKEMELSIEESNAKSVTLKDLLAGPVLKPLFMSMFLMFLQQYGGINAVLFNSVVIFDKAGTSIKPEVANIIIGVTQVVTCIVTCLIVEKLGRKVLVFVSDLGMAISLAALGFYFYMLENENAEGLKWLPLPSLIVYIITYNLGLGPLAWTMMGELLPNHVKGLTSAIASGFCWGLAFLVTKTFQDMQSGLNDSGTFWFFAGISLLGSVFAITILPETKGKSIDEIQRHFGG